MGMLRQSSRSGTVHLLDVISHLVLNGLLMLRFVSMNLLAAVLVQKAHAFLVLS